ncbi:Zn(2)-Cys(6) zinc finger domain protein, partial [Tolypocladium paradoxum]
MAPTPPSVDAPTAASTPGNLDDRTRRNVACVNCRNSKVRCRTSQVPGQPCQRCTKLHISCVVDKAHKRVTKRSKLEQLELELKSIKQVVNPSANGHTAWTPPSPRATFSALPEQTPAPA